VVGPDELERQHVYGRDMFYMHDIGWGWWALLSIGVVVFWGAVVYAIVSFMRLRAVERADGPWPESPDQILKRRLAEGDLSIDEYERLNSTLHPERRTPGHRTSAPTNELRSPATATTRLEKTGAGP
jgi:uncharacterized membrane protein